MSNSVTKIILDKRQTAFIESERRNGVAVVSGTVSEIASVLSSHVSTGCKIVFNTRHAPNFKRCFNAYVKRATRIATEAEVVLSEPAEYFIDGYRQLDMFVMEVL